VRKPVPRPTIVEEPPHDLSALARAHPDQTRGAGRRFL